MLSASDLAAAFLRDLPGSSPRLTTDAELLSALAVLIVRERKAMRERCAIVAHRRAIRQADLGLTASANVAGDITDEIRALPLE